MAKLVFRVRPFEFPEATEIINATAPIGQGEKTPVGQTKLGNFFDLGSNKVVSYQAYVQGGQIVISAEIAERQRAAAGCSQAQKLINKLTRRDNRWQMIAYYNPHGTTIAGRERSNATDRAGNLRPIVPVHL